MLEYRERKTIGGKKVGKSQSESKPGNMRWKKK